MINRCIGCYYHDNKENVCTHGSPIFLDDVCTDYQDSEFVMQIRADAINECADKFAEILSNVTNICGKNCPVKCNWGTEETCEEMCKKWFINQLKEQK